MSLPTVSPGQRPFLRVTAPISSMPVTVAYSGGSVTYNNFGFFPVTMVQYADSAFNTAFNSGLVGVVLRYLPTLAGGP